MSTATTTMLMPPSRTPATMFPTAGCSYSHAEDRHLNVRFDEECILIPPPAKKPAMVTVSYSLPVWRRRAGDVADNESDGQSSSEVTFKVALPRFMSRSSSRSRRPSHSPRTSPDMRNISPCLVQRAPSSESTSSEHRLKSPRLESIPVLPTSPRPDVATVPLRSCCTNCIPTLEDCVKLGDEWTEKFTNKAQRRRRRASLDGGRSSMETAFLAVDLNKLDQAPLVTEDDIQQQEADTEPESEDQLLPSPALRVRPSLNFCLEPLKISAPIREEDDDQLFPLPSPRRTPTSSPAHSPNASTSNVSVNICGPRTASAIACGSHDSLPLPSACASGIRRQSSNDSTDEGSASESLVGGGRCVKGLLTPEPSPAKPSAKPSYRPPPVMSRSMSMDSPTGPKRAYKAPFFVTPPTPDSPSESMLPPSISRSSRKDSASTSTSASPERKRDEKRVKVEKRKSARFSGQQFWKAGADVLKGVSMSPPMHV
ncbi:hypothetical protein FIBSPDRAFT_904930 [Athelia psychrophila]|uniref:Uncharacterized protein n=1 Tax=Athelia psychrophila TaxID=1759441 RepID=A0A167U3T0_9AGAM|nr:hypothetical protein FIBSPDRAFT_904930 [Fibularhizoctonia sp. CBS 109695]